MRSLLFVPGHSAKMMAKAMASGADVVIFDLEDAVHPDSKPAARQLVVDALANRANGSPAGYVRVNALDSAWCAGDLEAVMPARPDGIMLPKPEGPEDLHRLDALMTRWERPGASRPGSSPSAPRRPRPRCRLRQNPGLTRAWPDCCGAAKTCPRPSARAPTATRTANIPAPFALARSLCLLAARAAGVAPIDAVFTDFRDNDKLKRETDAARRDGFSAKAAIHPLQVDIINRCFTPTDDERRWSERVIAAFEASDSGAVQIDGVMLDAPHLAQARRIMASLASRSN